MNRDHLPIPEPITLWKWAARNSQRHADGLPLSLVGFYKRALRATNRQPRESHHDYAKRALAAATRLVVTQRKADGAIIKDWVQDALAGVVSGGE